ncbi:50S ribosomal protein L4 [Candidatus Berkelbacteria bacterium]|nr:50S ribosomal protein L4 [Candidatus Berkelbacteria bacterium]
MSPTALKPATPLTGLVAAKAAAKTIATVIRAYAANQRQSTSHTKTRGDVRGGGRKPWKQKGTGRARTGSIRGPQWRTGGVAFGPKNVRNFTLALPQSLRTSALKSALALHQDQQRLYVVTAWPTDGKTKGVAALIGELAERPTLIVLASPDAILQRAARNLPNVRLRLASQLTITDVLTVAALLGTDEAYQILAKRLNVTAPTKAQSADKPAPKKRTTKKAV